MEPFDIAFEAVRVARGCHIRQRPVIGRVAFGQDELGCPLDTTATAPAAEAEADAATVPPKLVYTPTVCPLPSLGSLLSLPLGSRITAPDASKVDGRLHDWVDLVALVRQAGQRPID